jgi:diketogulonate reductase-like aldo/keto reductase
MNIPVKTLPSDFSLPVFGLGTWEMGGRHERNLDNDDERDITTIQKALQMGITHIDTAEAYAAGYTETLIGKAIQSVDRKKLFLTSKVSADHLLYADVMTACKASLKRLQTDYLDLYLVHKPNPEIPIADTMHALDDLVAEGLIKHIGVSNFNNERLEEAQFYAKNKIVANEVHYNLTHREVERKNVLTYCENNDIMVIAYRPVGKGTYAKKSITILDEMCKKYHKSPTQIAINWLTSQPNIVTIAKTSDPKHLKENIEALDFTMSPEDIETLRREFPDQQDISDIVPLV